jgi:orotidine-5'-phosphate decarboxylase
MNPLIYALDADGIDAAGKWVERLKDHVGVFKIGFQLFLREGQKVIEMVNEKGCKVFLDLKFHDIPHTVEKASREATRMGVFMFNVHASGGKAMMEAAARGAEAEAAGTGIEKPRVLGVTVLTSLDKKAVEQVGFSRGPEQQVELLAGLAKESGLDGVVASPMEAKKIKEVCGPDFLVVCPGIRPSGADAGDQARVATPAGAIRSGADYIVVGRPIREAEDPVAAARMIAEEAKV